ncbi:MAG TPA: class I SAM-dependent methyltransferase [Methanothrix sp.]|nr:class I SAM-dependent methyltransferase [Methanothrix sp.]
MLLNRLLGLDEAESIFLAEESWQDLIDLPVSAEIMQEELAMDSCIEIKGLGFVLHLTEPARIWLLLTDRYSSQKILSDIPEQWKGHVIRSVKVEDSDFFLAINEYFSTSMAEGLFCDVCSQNGAIHHVEERIERLVDFLRAHLDSDDGILEVCCGSGMATQALFRLGLHPLVMDSDRCDMCTALKNELLDPQKSFVLDARHLPCMFPERSFGTVLGFMVGLIDDFNWPQWRDILLKASSLAQNRVLFTVYTQREAELIAKALGSAGWTGQIIDNRDFRGIYDQWAYSGTRSH